MKFDPLATIRATIRKAKGRLTHDWRARARDYSSRVMQAGALLQGAYLAAPVKWQAMLPGDTAAMLGFGMFLAGALAKVITEPGRPGNPP